jgi:hypothetical protein
LIPVLRASLAALVWGFAEATLFFIVPDVLLSYLGLKHGVRLAVRTSLFAALGAAYGGALMYAWSAHDAAAAHAAVLAVPAVSADMAARAAAAMEANWFAATLLGPLSSTPFKLYAVLAPQAGAGLGAFALAAIAARLPRFLIVSVGAALLSRALAPYLSERWRLGLLAAAWLIFYVAFFALMPN